jgi:hypothetical protein
MCICWLYCVSLNIFSARIWKTLKRGNEPSGSVKFGEILTSLATTNFPKNGVWCGS